jgi:ADP-ribose pyrophosphatase YjhB (NUDIX family)
MSVWRPPSIVRPIAIGIVRRGDELLLMVVRSDDGAIKGYRPLGGSIEFGERAAEALKREFSASLSRSSGWRSPSRFC